MNLNAKLLGVCAGTLLACAPTAEPTDLGFTQSGLKTQGQKLQGQKLQGQKLQGLRIGGAEVAGVDLVGTQLIGWLGDRALRGADFVGATLQGFDAAGAQVEVTIRAMEADAADPSGETFLYTLGIWDAARADWENPCQADAEQVQKAIPVRGVWDNTGRRTDTPGQITFGCTSGVIAKCVRWGYRPWQTRGGRSLQDYHQTCTRLARADYCGDGRPHTEEGTLVDVYDDLGLLTRTPDSGMLFDAAWTPDGAYCIQKERWLRLSNLLDLGCRLKFLDIALLELNPAQSRSPVDPQDVCLMRRTGADREQVRMDNRSGLNARLL